VTVTWQEASGPRVVTRELEAAPGGGDLAAHAQAVHAAVAAIAPPAMVAAGPGAERWMRAVFGAVLEDLQPGRLSMLAGPHARGAAERHALPWSCLWRVGPSLDVGDRSPAPSFDAVADVIDRMPPGPTRPGRVIVVDRTVIDERAARLLWPAPTNRVLSFDELDARRLRGDGNPRFVCLIDPTNRPDPLVGDTELAFADMWLEQINEQIARTRTPQDDARAAGPFGTIRSGRGGLTRHLILGPGPFSTDDTRDWDSVARLDRPLDTATLAAAIAGAQRAVA
jgi:hypothetical protein